MSEEDLSNQNHATQPKPLLSEEDRTVRLKKQIRAAKRKQNIGLAAFLVDIGLGPVLAGIAESNYDASKYGTEPYYSIEFSILLLSIWLALFVLGILTVRHYSYQIKKLERSTPRDNMLKAIEATSMQIENCKSGLQKLAT